MNENNLNNEKNNLNQEEITQENNNKENVSLSKNKFDMVFSVIIVILLGGCMVWLFSSINVYSNKNKNDKSTLTTNSEITSTSSEDITSKSSEATTSIETTTVSESVLSSKLIDKIYYKLNNTFHDTTIIAGKNYLEDNDFKFAFFVYLYSYESENVGDSGEDGGTGLFKMNVDTFNSLYFKSFGEQFDINKLNNTSTFYKGVKFPSISDNYIKSGFYTGPDPFKYQFEYIGNNYSDGLYALNFKYGTMIEDGEELKISPLGNASLKLSVDPKGFVRFKSFICSK